MMALKTELREQHKAHANDTKEAGKATGQQIDSRAREILTQSISQMSKNIEKAPEPASGIMHRQG